ncbi:MAG: hypothetical protein LKM45_05900 [Wolbachia endosymbiont of Alcedoecus sp.]|nr:hypothetical protein [Wolbachia endosymbiont of Alcedoecus sp.]
MDNKLIYSLIQEFRPELSSKEIEKYSSELQKLSSRFDQLHTRYVCENKLGLLFDARYQIKGKVILLKIINVILLKAWKKS